MTTAQNRPYQDVADLKRHYPLLDVVERAGVRLRRSGSHRFQGLCPFHVERTPSFFIDTERQRFTCFGCKVRGDVLDFVKLRENLTTFGEACAWLTGTPVAPSQRVDTTVRPSEQRDRRWDRLTLEQQLVLNAAGTLYRDAL